MQALFAKLKPDASTSYESLDPDVEEQQTYTFPGSNYVRNVFGGEEPENDSMFPEMSYSTRVTGFLCCFALGFLLSFFSSFNLMSGHVKGFAFVYTVGNIVAVAGSTFLVGIQKQLDSMFDENRKISALSYFLFLFLTLFSALSGMTVFVVLLFLMAQWAAGVWYSASYIPYGRSTIKSCISSFL